MASLLVVGIWGLLCSSAGDGKTITCYGTHVDAATGKEVKVRTVTTISDKDAFTLELMYAAGEEAKTVTLTHKRKNTP